MTPDETPDQPTQPDHSPGDLFLRNVVSAEPEDDQGLITAVTLDCGHSSWVICYQPSPSLYCPQCVQDMLLCER